MTGRMLHISDLHLGHATAPEPLERLRELIPDLDPEILVVTGDLTHRGRPAELERARELLESLGLPLLAVPGNHDIPYVFPTRFTRTREAWERVFGTAEPVYTSERLAIVGMNSVRPWRQQGGALESSQLDGLAPKLERCPGGSATDGGTSPPSCRTTLARRTQTSRAPARPRPAEIRVHGSGARAERPRPSERRRRASRVRSGRARSTYVDRPRDCCRLRAAQTGAPWRGARIQLLRVRPGEHLGRHVVLVRWHVRSRSDGGHFSVASEQVCATNLRNFQRGETPPSGAVRPLGRPAMSSCFRYELAPTRLRSSLARMGSAPSSCVGGNNERAILRARREGGF